MFKKILKWIAHFQAEHPYFTVMLIASLTIIIYGGVSQVRTVASLEQMMPDDIEEIKAFNVLRDNYMGQDIIAIVMQVDRQSSDTSGVLDIRDKRVYDYISHIHSQIKAEPDVIEVFDATNIVAQFPQYKYEQVIKDPRLQSSFSNFIDDDYTTTMILITTDVAADDSRMILLTRKIKSIVNSAGHPPGVEIKFTGTPVIQQKLGELITKDRNFTQLISTILVFIVTMITFGTVTSAIVPIIVVTLSVNWLYGTMGYNDLPISTLAGGVAAMVIGIGIDFAIHIMNKFKYERKKGNSVKKAVEKTVVETGTALTATSLTTIAAFLAFLIGRMPEMGRFGILMAIGIAFSLMFSLFGLPALLIIEEKIINYLRKKMKFGVEGEYHLEK